MHKLDVLVINWEITNRQQQQQRKKKNGIRMSMLRDVNFEIELEM